MNWHRIRHYLICCVLGYRVRFLAPHGDIPSHSICSRCRLILREFR